MSLQNKRTDDEHTTCQSCHEKLVYDVDIGEKICSHCGIVIMEQSDNLSRQTNLSSINVENENIKEPTSLMMYDIGLPTFIGKKNIDASGKQIQKYSDIEKLRRLNRFTISNDSKTRNLNKAMREIRRITEILGLSPAIAERASYIYRKALNRKLIRGRSITGIVVATIYIACIDVGVYFPMDKIVNLVENCNRKNVVHYYKLLLRRMEMNVGVPDPVQYVSRIAARARLSGKTERRALEILSQIQGDPMLSGKKPISIATAALYLAALQVKEHTTQLRLAIASELTTITIRKICTEIDNVLKQRTTQFNSHSKQTENINSVSPKIANPQNAITIVTRTEQ